MTDATFQDALARWVTRAAEWDALPQEEKDRRSQQAAEEETRRLRAAKEAHVLALLEAVPPRYRSATVEHPVARKWVEDYVGGKTARGLYLVGPTGTGKTWLMMGMYRALAELGLLGCRIVSMPKLLDELRPREDAATWDTLNRYFHATVLFIDDVGAHKPTEWAEEKFYEIVDHRWEWQRPIIIGTNIPRDIGNVIGERSASRLAGMCDLLKLTGPDLRRNRG